MQVLEVKLNLTIFNQNTIVLRLYGTASVAFGILFIRFVSKRTEHRVSVSHCVIFFFFFESCIHLKKEAPVARFKPKILLFILSKTNTDVERYYSGHCSYSCDVKLPLPLFAIHF